VRILFCGDCFPASQSLLKERLPIGEDEIVVCDGINLRKALANCDVVIPMMTILDEAIMEAGSVRLVQQWGSGLEGVDLDAARARGTWVANVPASGNNADSVAEHALAYTRFASPVARGASERECGHSRRAVGPHARGPHSMGRFESLFLISPSEPNCLGRLKLTRHGFDVLGRRGEPVPNDTQGGD
jgi:hypothetical protein